jgi:hypothetical protein
MWWLFDQMSDLLYYTGTVVAVQHYVIKFVSDLQQVGGILHQ